MEKNWKDLGRAVAFARETAGLTQEGLADHIAQSLNLAVSSRTIGTLERGIPVNDHTLRRVAAGLGWAPDVPEAILSGVQAVGLAGELLTGSGSAQFSGAGSLTTVPRWSAQEPPAETTLQDARAAVADHERDFSLAAGNLEDWLHTIKLILAGDVEGFEPLEAVEAIESEFDKMVTFDQGRRYWQRQVDLLRRQEPEPLAARRGRKSQVDGPEPHAE